MITFGSGQTGGQPLLLTTSFQTLHTAPAGTATPHLVEVQVLEIGSVPCIVTLQVLNSGGTVVSTQTINTSIAENGKFTPLVLNATSVLKVAADRANAAQVVARVDDQTTGVKAQVFASGLVAAVQNASRHAIGALGGTGQATEANANVMVPVAGTLKMMAAKADTTVGGGATVTVTVRKNAADTALTTTIAAADTTTLKTVTADVAVVAGDLLTLKFATDNAGAPAANIQAAFTFIPA